jgi:hypothetical protein
MSQSGLTKSENKILIDKRLKFLRLRSKIVLAFDFDELIVPIPH